MITGVLFSIRAIASIAAPTFSLAPDGRSQVSAGTTTVTGLSAPVNLARQDMRALYRIAAVLNAFSSYSRQKPSRQFGELVTLYSTMHEDGYVREFGPTAREQVTAEETFPGDAIPMWAWVIRAGAARYGAKTLLDYGAGKGDQYRRPFQITDEATGSVFEGSLADYWGGIEVSTFEPGLGDPHPSVPADVVVNADVLEHCFAGDIPWIVDDMFSLARKFLFVNVACYPAAARLPTGENAHITVRSPDYWRGLFDAVGNAHPGVDWVLACSRGWGVEHTTFFRRGEYELQAAGVFAVG